LTRLAMLAVGGWRTFEKTEAVKGDRSTRDSVKRSWKFK